MPSQPRNSAREEERRLNLQTLAIASLASAAAAVVTSQFWIQGTWMAAAVTPVIVALVSELLHKPTTVIRERVTSRDMGVVRETEPERPARPEPAPERSTRTAPGREAPVRVYRAGARGGPSKPAGPGSGPGSRRRRIAVGVVALTAVLAFAITAVAITGTELLTGGSIGNGDDRTTLFGGERKQSNRSSEEGEQPSGGSQEQQPEGESGSGGRQGDGGEQPQPTQPSEEPPPESEPQPVPETPSAPAPQQP